MHEHTHGQEMGGGEHSQDAPNSPAPYLAETQALDLFGSRYAQYIRKHLDSLYARGIDRRHESLGAILAGNDGD